MLSSVRFREYLISSIISKKINTLEFDRRDAVDAVLSTILGSADRLGSELITTPYTPGGIKKMTYVYLTNLCEWNLIDVSFPTKEDHQYAPQTITIKPAALDLGLFNYKVDVVPPYKTLAWSWSLMDVVALLYLHNNQDTRVTEAVKNMHEWMVSNLPLLTEYYKWRMGDLSDTRINLNTVNGTFKKLMSCGCIKKDKKRYNVTLKGELAIETLNLSYFLDSNHKVKLAC